MNWNWVYVITIAALNLLLWFWKSRTEAIAKEKGTIIARNQDLELILTEVKAVTASQKEIEAKISDRVWERQWRLNQKRDAYVGLLNAFTELGSIYAKMQLALRGLANEDYTHVDAQIPDLLAGVDRAVSFARLFVSPEALAAVEAYRRHVIPGDRSARADAGRAAVREAEASIVAAARADLGLDTPEQATGVLKARHAGTSA